jgi:hypothetical protein
LGEMGPLAPAASSPLAGLGMAAVIIAQALHLGPFWGISAAWPSGLQMSE